MGSVTVTGGVGTPRPSKARQRASRSSTSCYPCRARKAKCGCLPPGPCPYCAKHSITCTWPTEDRRTTRFDTQAGGSPTAARERTFVEPTANVETLTLPSTSYQTLSDFLGLPWDRQDVETQSGLELGAQFDDFVPLPNPFDYTIESELSDNASFPRVDATKDLSTLNFHTLGALGLDPFLNQLPGFHHADGQNGTGWSEGSGLALETRMGHARRTTIKWRRHHGPTAFVAGVQAVSLNIQIQPTTTKAPSSGPSPYIGFSSIPSAMRQPETSVMRHLLQVFEVHFGSQFPFLDYKALNESVEDESGSAFLLNCIAAMAARFSQHPSVALTLLEPHAYGDAYFERAKSMIGSVLTVPLRETVMGFIFLAHCAASASLWSEIWMFTSNAVSMAYDLGLHLDASAMSGLETSLEDSRQDKLVFWAVVILDFVVALGLGRPTAFRLELATQSFPVDSEISSLRTDGVTAGPQSPFPYLAKLMFLAGILFNLVNSDGQKEPQRHAEEVTKARLAVMRHYQDLPEELRWSVENFRTHDQKRQGSTFICLHTWAVACLTLTVASPAEEASSTSPSLSGARTIGEIITLCDLINPTACLTWPFICHPLYLAGSVLSQEIRQTCQISSLRDDAVILGDTEVSDIMHSLLRSVASTQLSYIKQVLRRISRHWLWAEWIVGSLDQRIDGSDADLSSTGNVFPASVVFDWALPRKYHSPGAHVN